MGWLDAHQAHRTAASSESDFATNEDFRKLFTKGMSRLYQLCFLLTADHEKAEQCFVASLDDCVNGNSVFLEWVDSWARRLIVRNAMQIIQPRPGNAAPELYASHPVDDGNLSRTVLRDPRFSRVLALEDFERFVFVLSVLERYPDHSCAVLLRTSQLEVRAARVRALDHMADFDTECARRVVDLVAQA